MLNYLINLLTSVFRIEDKFSKVNSFHPDILMGVGSKYSNENITKEGKSNGINDKETS